MKNLYADRIEILRTLMKENGWEAVLIGGSDPHSSEYPAPRWQQVQWLSGFTGEAGDLVITQDHAGLWTDSRYFIQANNQLEGTGVELHKTRIPGEVSIPEWLSAHAAVVVLDATAQSLEAVQEIEAALKEKYEEEYKICAIPDLLERIWADRPSHPISPIITLGADMVGESRQSKLSWIRRIMDQKGVDYSLFSSLDEIAWILNVRGEDIDYNPLIISYLLVGHDMVKWYVKKDATSTYDPDTVSSFDELKSDGVGIMYYSELSIDLMDLFEDSEQEEYSIMITPASLNYNVYQQIKACFGFENIVNVESPVILRKAIKNETEIKFFREAHLEDGVAMEKFLFWLEREVASCRELNEWEISLKLTEFRAQIPGYRGNSFENISAYAANGALPHYSTPEDGSASVWAEGLYLVDSGGQYLFGTTDITRTIPLGPCTEQQKEDYTLVLKGMISLSMAVFPRGTTGAHLDILARNPLWSKMRNFGHGTGHGVGFYLCVHEGPQGMRQNLNPQPILPGMVTSNEPAIYREGQYGIRHENLVLCKELGQSEFGDWLGFETLTLCHIDTSAIVKDLLDSREILWLNEYHERVYQTLSPYLDQEHADWLRRKTAAI